MRNVRVMDGLEDLTGQQFGTLKVGDMTVRRPEPRYRVICAICSTQGTETQSRLSNGTSRCLYSGCGKAPAKRSRDLLADQRQRIADRDAERVAAAQHAAELRMAAETGEYELRTRFAPKDEPYQPASERERLALRERREAEERERIEAEAPRLEAERLAAEEQQATEEAHRERNERRRAYWAEAVQSSADPKLFLSQPMQGVSMSKAEADAHNGREANKFVAETPEYREYRVPSNSDKILRYFQQNGVNIFDVPTLKAAFIRLRDLGVLEKTPASQPQPAETPKRVNLSLEPSPTKPAEPSGPKFHRGRDFATGMERDFTEREVARMSSAEYRRAFPVLGTVSELFTKMNDQR